MDVIVTRCCNNYGPYQHPEKLIPLLITKILNGEDLPIYGDGKNVREWIHVSDHARAIALLTTKGISGEIYNIGSSTELSNLDLVNIILTNFENDKAKVTFVKDRRGHDFRYSLNSQKISELGYKNLKMFSEDLKSTIQWFAKK
jgi:dTDP-glucose 4,6-dehydratase